MQFAESKFYGKGTRDLVLADATIFDFSHFWIGAGFQKIRILGKGLKKVLLCLHIDLGGFVCFFWPGCLHLVWCRFSFSLSVSFTMAQSLAGGLYV